MRLKDISPCFKSFFRYGLIALPMALGLLFLWAALGWATTMKRGERDTQEQFPKIIIRHFGLFALSTPQIATELSRLQMGNVVGLLLAHAEFGRLLAVLCTQSKFALFHL
jgi:hypothetical protein